MHGWPDSASAPRQRPQRRHRPCSTSCGHIGSGVLGASFPLRIQFSLHPPAGRLLLVGGLQHRNPPHTLRPLPVRRSCLVHRLFPAKASAENAHDHASFRIHRVLLHTPQASAAVIHRYVTIARDPRWPDCAVFTAHRGVRSPAQRAVEATEAGVDHWWWTWSAQTSDASPGCGGHVPRLFRPPRGIAACLRQSRSAPSPG